MMLAIIWLNRWPQPLFEERNDEEEIPSLALLLLYSVTALAQLLYTLGGSKQDPEIKPHWNFTILKLAYVHLA